MTTPIVELLNGVSAWENRNRSNQNFAALLQIIEEKGFVWQGDYVDAWQYIKWDIVKYNYSLYIAKIPTIGLIPTNNSAWDLLVESFQGETGPTGPQWVSVSSIVRTSWTGSPWTFDTYTITFSNATTTTFQVWNGSNGTGNMNTTDNLAWLANTTTARSNLWVYSTTQVDWLTHAAAVKATPVDADEFSIWDSAASWVLKKLTFANLKAVLKTYFDSIYQVQIDTAVKVVADEVTINNGGWLFISTPTEINDLFVGGVWSTLQVQLTGYGVNKFLLSDANGNLSYTAFGDSVKSQFTTINSQTGTTYTFALTDAWAMVTFNNAAAQTITVPPNSSVAFPIGTQIDCSQLGAGKVTFAQWAGVTIQSKGSNKAISAQYVGATLKKIGTDTWLLLGDLIA